jgi:hypothetical protein
MKNNLSIQSFQNGITIFLFIGIALLGFEGKAQTKNNIKNFTPEQKVVMKEAFKNLRPDQRAKILADIMKSVLPLRESQYKPIYAINHKYAQKVGPILKSNDSKISKFYQINVMQSDKESEYKKILTEQQFKKYMELKESLMKKAMSKSK